MKNKNFLRKVAMIIVFALVITSFAGITNVNKVRAAVTAGNVVYEGNGSLSCGSSTLELKDAVLTYSGSTTIKYWDNPVAGTMVINQTDKLGHVFWYSGIYFVIDMNTGAIIQAYKNSQNSYCLKSSGTAVYASSAYMATINTCIIDDEWFYQEGMAKMQRLMTRAEFDSISNGQDPTAPTPTPTVEPTVEPTQEPTPTPTVEPTQEPTPTPTVEPTQEPTQEPTATPTVEPTQVPTSMPTVEPTQKPGNGSLTEGIVDNDINGDGNTTNTSIDQDITINNTVTNVTVNGNNNSVGTSVGTAANALPIKPAIVSTSTKKKSTTKSKTVKPKTYYGAIQSGFRLKLYKVTQKVTNGKIKTVRQWKSICLFDKKKERMDWNAFKLKKVKKCQFSNKKHWIVIIKKNGKVYACPSGKGTKKVKYIGKGAVAFKCNSRGLATSYVKKNGTVVKLKY